MKKMQWIDLFREIRKSRGRYLSLLFIVALGTAFYAGVRSSEPDMTASADYYYDETKLMDIRVIGTLGLTEDDLQKITDTEGILTAQGGYNGEYFALCQDSKPILNVVSTCDEINQLTVKEGRLPQAADECFLDTVLMRREGYQLGDRIQITDGDGKVPENLHKDTFTIVGYGTWSWYLSIQRGSASIGNGKVDAFMALSPEAFDMDYYTVIYALVNESADKNSFTDPYKDAVTLVTDRLEEIADERCEIRYTDIRSEAEEKLADARKEVADARKELADAKEKLEDGESEYADGLSKYEDGKEEYEDGLSAFNKGKKKLEDSRKQLDQAKKDYKKGLAAWTEGKAELDAAEKQLKDGEKQLKDGQQELTKGQKELEKAKAELDTQNKKVAAGLEQIAVGEAQIEAGKKQLADQEEALESAKAEYEQGKSAYEQGMFTLEHMDPAAAPLAYESLRQQMAGLKASLDAADSQIKEGESQLFAAKKQLSEQEKTLKANKKELKAAEKQIAAGYKTIAENQKKLDASKKLLDEKTAEMKEGKDKLAAGKAELAASKKQLDDGKKMLDQGEKAYADGKKELDSSKKKLTDAKAELEDAEQELIDARKELDDGWKEYQDALEEAEPELADADQEIADAEKDLADLKVGSWYVLGRDSIQNSVEYGMDTERIGAIGKVFPAIFFLVAALVSLTTMTRMIEEERMMIGTMKAMGYGKLAIASKYIIYAFSATLFGGILGVIAGSKILPYVILTAYGMLYNNVPYRLIPLHPGLCISSIAIAIVCTVGAAMAACYKELLSTPAALMRPPAPKQGKRVFLEYLPFLWKRLNFSMKSTIRNLFRYKKRFFMTVFGIGGCMAVLLVSFGLHDSIAEIVNKQYKSIWTYSAYGNIDEDASLEEKEALISEILDENQNISDAMLTRQISLDVSANGSEKSVYLFVPANPRQMESYLHLHDRVTDTPYTLTDEGAIITEKLAGTLNVAAGDYVTLKLSDTEYKDVKITAVSENYMFHYLYITPVLYRKLYGEEAAYNQLYVKFTDDVEKSGEETAAQKADGASKAGLQESGASRSDMQEADLQASDSPRSQTSLVNEASLAEYLLEKEEISSISLVTSLQESVDNMMNALNLVVWVLIISAGLLVFVVLFNLNNINISERRRELASLKVLGFYDLEVAMYVYRENIFLTLFGILAGLFMGTWLHSYTILTLEVDMIMFGRKISFMGYLYSVIYTIVFSILVNLGMYYKLKQIDMVESLKSVE